METNVQVPQKQMSKTKLLTISAVLVAFGFVIPYFMPSIQVVPGYVTVTIGSHAPIMMAMFINPLTALITSLLTTVAFLAKGMPLPIVIRAFSHCIFAVLGSFVAKKCLNKKLTLVLFSLVISLIHAFFEIIAVYVSFLILGGNQVNISPFYVFVIVGAVSIVHSLVDFFIAYFIYLPINKAKLLY